MPKAAEARDGAQQTTRDGRVRALEEQVRKLGYANDDLRGEVFRLSQRDNRLAESMGFATVEELEAAIAGRPQIFHKQFLEETTHTMQALETRIAEHIRLDAVSREGLADAAEEINRLSGENAQLREYLEAVTKEKDGLVKRVKELESGSSCQRPQGVSSTGLPTPSTTVRKSALPLTDITPRHRPGFSPRRSESESTPGPLTVTPATPSLPPFTLSPDTESNPIILRAELRALHAQYEALRLVKERAEAKYRADYNKWRSFKRWMFDEEKASLADIVVDGRTPNFGNVMKVRRHYMRTGPQEGTRAPAASGSHAADIRAVMKNDAEIRETVAALPDEFDQVNPAAPQSSLTARLLEARQPQPPNTASVQDVSAALSTSAAHSSNRSTASSAVSKGKKRASEEALEPVAGVAASSPLTPQRKRQRYEDSSETEEESQALSPMLESQPGLRRLVPMPDGTYVRRGYGPYPGDAGPSAKAAAIPQSPSTPRKPGTPGSRRSKRTPTKSPSSRHSTPRKQKERLVGTPTRRTPGTRNRLEKENPSAAQGRPADYSVYKGRGRYAAGARPEEDTINARYEIDVARNNGVDHPFEEVVRDKERRKQLHGADCECCREYYKAVGRLPPRPQAPLWRSPHATPTKTASAKRRHLADASGVPNSPHKHRRSSDADEGNAQDPEEADIAAHVQQISRHRQQWERPKTPPSYWEIAFPDTQEAAAINQQAKEMHAQKQARVAEEANRGGRYKKRMG